MKKNKKILILLILLSFVFSGCSKKGYIEMNYNDLQNRIDNKETFVLFIGSDSCSACSLFKEILNEKSNEHKNVSFYYIDVSKLTDFDVANLSATYDWSQTPTMFIINKGKQEGKYIGADKYPDIIKGLKNKGII